MGENPLTKCDIRKHCYVYSGFCANHYTMHLHQIGTRTFRHPQWRAWLHNEYSWSASAIPRPPGRSKEYTHIGRFPYTVLRIITGHLRKWYTYPDMGEVTAERKGSKSIILTGIAHYGSNRSIDMNIQLKYLLVTAFSCSARTKLSRKFVNH